MCKNKNLMCKTGYLGLKILDISNIEMDEFCYDYIKSRYSKKSNYLI